MEEKLPKQTESKIKKVLLTFFWVSILVFVLDIVSKWCIVNHWGKEALAQGISHSDYITVIPNFFYFGGSLNLGAAYSFLAGEKFRPLWIVVSVVFSGVLIFYYVKNMKKMNVPSRIAFTLMIGGALGNMIDRAFYWKNIVGFDGVVDFLVMEIGGNAIFGSFNVADSALVIGVVIFAILLIIDIIKDMNKTSSEKDKRILERMQEKKENENNSK